MFILAQYNVMLVVTCLVVMNYAAFDQYMCSDFQDIYVLYFRIPTKPLCNIACALVPIIIAFLIRFATYLLPSISSNSYVNYLVMIVSAFACYYAVKDITSWTWSLFIVGSLVSVSQIGLWVGTYVAIGSVMQGRPGTSRDLGEIGLTVGYFVLSVPVLYICLSISPYLHM